MFTQYGPYNEEGWPEGSRERYGQQCLDTLGAVAPNVKDAVVHYEVLAPPDLERIFGLLGGNIFQGEQGLDQMAFMRPDAGAGAVRDAGRRAVPVRRGHAPGRRRHGRRRAQRGQADPAATSGGRSCARGWSRRATVHAARRRSRCERTLDSRS